MTDTIPTIQDLQDAVGAAVKALVSAEVDAALTQPPPVDPPPADPPPADPPADPPPVEVPPVDPPVVVDPPPDEIASKVVAGVHVVVAGTSVTFTDQSTSTRPIKSVLIGYGLGTTSVEIGAGGTVTLAYPKVGTFGPTLTAIDDLGVKSTVWASVTIPSDSDDTYSAAKPSAPSPPPKDPNAPPAPPATPGVAAKSVIDATPLNSPVGGGPNTVEVEGVDALDREWKAVGHTGDDLAAPRLRACMVDADGKPHARMQVVFYADGCKVNCARMDNACDELGWKSLKVTYNGVAVAVPPSSYADGTYDFWRGTAMPTIRYGKQAQWDASKIRWDLLPSYPRDGTQPLRSDAKNDYRWNGLGSTWYPDMSVQGEREDIGFMEVLMLAFILNPCQETWDVVRRAEDWSGNWSMVGLCEPATGGIIDYTAYGSATTLPPAQSGAWQSNNPIAGYAGSYRGDTLTPPKDGWSNSGCPFHANSPHLTSYGMLAVMITGAAHDKDNCSFWANYGLLDINPAYTKRDGCMMGAQRRSAWVMRSLFIAAYLSSDKEYFMAETMRNIAILNAYIVSNRNDWGIIDWAVVYPCVGSAKGYLGMAKWMQSYMAMSFDAISRKIPEALPISRYMGLLEKTWHDKPYYMHATNYVFVIRSPDQKMLTSFDEMVRMSIITAGFSDATAASIIAAGTAEEVYNLTAADLAARGALPMQGKCADGVTDFMGRPGSSSSYPVGAIAATIAAANAGTPGIELAVQHVQGLPTKPDYAAPDGYQKYHLVLMAG